MLQVLPLTLVLPIAQERALGPAAFDKVLADSISSTSPQSNHMLTFARVGTKAHVGLDLVADTTSH
jgi:hypothetical protein